LAHAASLGGDYVVIAIEISADVAIEQVRSGDLARQRAEAVRLALRDVVSAKHPEVLQADLDAFDAGLAASAAVPVGGG
jgi:Flp pilus assembly protein CpaB